MSKMLQVNLVLCLPFELNFVCFVGFMSRNRKDLLLMLLAHVLTDLFAVGIVVHFYLLLGNNQC